MRERSSRHAPSAQDDFERSFVRDSPPTWKLVAGRLWGRWGVAVTLATGACLVAAGNKAAPVLRGGRAVSAEGAPAPAAPEASTSTLAPAPFHPLDVFRGPGLFPECAREDMVEVLGYHRTELLRPECADALERMLRAASRDGVELALASGFRSCEEQAALHAAARARLAGPGPHEEIDAGTRPARDSEHHTGLAVDLCDLASAARGPGDALAYTAEYAWLVRHAGAFGFAQGEGEVNRRPWHWRYEGDARSRALFGR